MEDSIRIYKSGVKLVANKAEKLEQILRKLKNQIDYNRLLESKESLALLEKIRSKYDRNDVFIPEVIDEIFKIIKCTYCSEFKMIKHSCGQFICKTCTENNNFACQSCNKSLPHSMVRKYFNISLSCISCLSPTGPEYSPSCGHFCNSCIFDPNILDLKGNNCLVCFKYIESNENNYHKCENCNICSSRKDMFLFCEEHLFCRSCSTYLIESGKCSCGAILKVSKVLSIYTATHFTCANCHNCYPENQRTRTQCGCNRDICHICFKLSCEVCSLGTFQVPPN